MTDSRRLTLLLGGARAGKSAAAERLARQYARVLFVATAEPNDADMEARIAQHRAQRPATWMTAEEPLDVAAAIRARQRQYDVVLLDCVTLWVSNLMHAGADVLRCTDELIQAYETDTASWIVVSNEVGLGIVPATELGRAYRDMLGRVNQALSARADEAYLMMAGRALPLRKL